MTFIVFIGKLPVKGSLEFVAVMIRHGDRAPLLPIQNQTTINCGTTHTPLMKNYLKTLKHQQGSIKHLPAQFQTIPLHPDLKECTQYQMTLHGAHQHLMVGQALKKSYIDKHGLLTMNWTSKDIKVYSSLTSRTFQSAVAFLFGFLPRFDMSSINIKPTLDYRFCMSNYYCNCPLLDQLYELQRVEKNQYLLNDTATMKIIEELASIVPYFNAFFVFDALMVHVCHSAPLPCIPGTNKCVTFEHIHKLIAHLSWVEQQQGFANSVGGKVIALKTQGFLNHLIYTINNYILGKDPTKFILYSAHDLTVQPLLSLFGIYDGLVPYAAHIAFEVYRTGIDTEVKYALRIVYKGKDVTKEVSFCKPYFESPEKLLDISEYYGLCPLESFYKFVAGLVSSMGFSSFKAFCNSPYFP